MKLEILITWFVLAVYFLVAWKKPLVEKKQKKWLIIWTLIVMGVSICILFRVHLDVVMDILYRTAGQFTKKVVNV